MDPNHHRKEPLPLRLACSLGFRGLGFRGLGFRGLGFRAAMSSSFLNPTVSVLSIVAGSACMACEPGGSVFAAKSLPHRFTSCLQPTLECKSANVGPKVRSRNTCELSIAQPGEHQIRCPGSLFRILEITTNKLSRVGNRPSNLWPRKPKSSFGCRPWGPRHLRRDNPRSPWRFVASAWWSGFNLVAHHESPDSSKNDDLELRPTVGLVGRGSCITRDQQPVPFILKLFRTPHRCQNQSPS